MASILMPVILHMFFFSFFLFFSLSFLLSFSFFLSFLLSFFLSFFYLSQFIFPSFLSNYTNICKRRKEHLAEHITDFGGRVSIELLIALRKLRLYQMFHFRSPRHKVLKAVNKKRKNQYVFNLITDLWILLLLSGLLWKCHKLSEGQEEGWPRMDDSK